MKRLATSNASTEMQFISGKHIRPGILNSRKEMPGRAQLPPGGLVRAEVGRGTDKRTANVCALVHQPAGRHRAQKRVLRQAAVITSRRLGPRIISAQEVVGVHAEVDRKSV